MTEARETTERAVVGCMLIDSRAIDSLVEQGGSASWFVDPQCRKVAQAVLERYEQGKIASDMLAINELGLVPMSWMDECIELVPTVAHTEHYVATLKGHADKDALVALHGAIGRIVGASTPETVREARESVDGLVSGALCEGAKSSGTMTDAAHSLIDKLTAPESENLLLDWPVRAITDAIGRMRNEYIWIVAQPSIGKTAFVLAILSHLAQQGHKVSLASLESDAESIAGRLISSTAPMSTLNLRQGRATPEEIAQAREAADKISDNIMVTDGAMTVDAAVAWGKAQVRAGSRLLVFDNTRYLEVQGESNRVERMAIMSTRLKRLRDQTGVPVLVLHHSTMDEKTGKDRSSWSSDPERDCDVMIFLRDNEENSKRPCAENPSGESCVNFDIAKHREGRKLVRVMLRFDKDTQRFSRWVDDPYITKEEDALSSSDKLFDNE